MMPINTLKIIEVEINSFCNRKCSWCPNKILDRTKAKELDEETYRNLIRELKNNSYDGTISYSRYNEPMAFPKLFKERVSYAKANLPNVKFVSNTNGDYLLKRNIEGLLIDELTVMDYDCKGINYCVNKLFEIGADLTNVDGNIIRAEKDDMTILYYANWTEEAEINDRGGSLSEYSTSKRGYRCKEPMYFAGIDYNGNVMPCCNLRSDNERHKPYILGNVNNQSLEEIYKSNKAKKIREQAGLLIPCEYCIKKEGRYTRDKPGIDYD